MVVGGDSWPWPGEQVRGWWEEEEEEEEEGRQAWCSPVEGPDYVPRGAWAAERAARIGRLWPRRGATLLAEVVSARGLAGAEAAAFLEEALSGTGRLPGGDAPGRP